MIEVYHGGTEIVSRPLVSVGRPNLDFGPGFYVTDLYEQAESWAIKMAEIRGTLPIVNKYLLSKTALIKAAKYRKFCEYDNDWLDFICNCRRDSSFNVEYNVIEGGIADDRVVNSIRMYMNGYIDADLTIRKLRHLKPNNQICINDQTLVDNYLKFDSYKVID